MPRGYFKSYYRHHRPHRFFAIHILTYPWFTLKSPNRVYGFVYGILLRHLYWNQLDLILLPVPSRHPQGGKLGTLYKSNSPQIFSSYLWLFGLAEKCPKSSFAKVMLLIFLKVSKRRAEIRMLFSSCF